MKKIITYLKDHFEDFNGDSHNFTLCAVSTTDVEGGYIYASQGLVDIHRNVHIGYSVCNTSDVYNSSLGEEIAYNRAMDSYPVLSTTRPGVINKDFINELLRKEADYIKKNPEYIIPGYNKKVEKVKKQKEALELYNNLSEEEKMVVKLISDPKARLLYEKIADQKIINV